MAGVKGRSGTNKNQDKPWRDALALAVNDIDPATKAKKLRKIAEKVIELAMAGDMQAVKEIGDRLEGKPHQSMDVSTHAENPSEMTDEQLLNIAAGSSAGDTESERGPAEPNSVH